MKVTVASVSQKDINDILGSSVRGGTLTVGHVLDFKDAKLEDLALSEAEWGWQAIATVSTPFGPAVHLGNGSTPFGAAFDALDRLATMLMRS